MSNLLQLIQLNNLKTFDELKSFISQPPYFIEVREDRPVSNLYLLFHTEQSDINNNVVRECNGVILDKNTNQIVSYGLDRVFSIEELQQISNYSAFNWDLASYNTCLDGTMLKVYYYNCKWNVSTSKCINSDKSRWSSTKSFLKLFQDCGIDFSTLDKNNCYSYILQHPETRLVVPVTSPKCTLVNVRNMNTLQSTPILNPVPNLPPTDKFSFVKSLPYNHGSALVTFANNITVRVDSTEFERVRDLRGNTPDIRLKYLEYLSPQNKSLKDDLEHYFSEYLPTFFSIDNDIVSLSKSIQDLYYKKFVLRQDITVPEKYQQTLRQLHGQFKKTKCVTTQDIVLQKLMSLPPSALYWILYQ